MGKNAYLLISAVVFGIVSLLHIVRVINNWTVVVGEWTIPMSISWLGLFGAAALCVWAISLATRETN